MNFGLLLRLLFFDKYERPQNYKYTFINNYNTYSFLPIKDVVFYFNPSSFIYVYYSIVFAINEMVKKT